MNTGRGRPSASEAGLQYLLGGISNLGGKVSGHVLENSINNISHANLRIAAKLGRSALSEASEEYLQEILGPVFRNLALGENNEFHLITEDAAYAALLAILTTGALEGPSVIQGERAHASIAQDGTGTGVDSRIAVDMGVDTPATQNPVEGIKNAPVEGARNEAGLVAISDREQAQLATGKRNIIASTVKDIVDFAKSALAKKGGQERLYMGVIPDSTAQMVLEQTGFDVTGYKAILTGDAVQHTRNRHGDAIREQARGQRVVTADDYGMIPQVLANPDSIELADGTDSSGRRVILFSKQIGDVYVTAQAVTDSRHALTTDTMWIQKRKGHQDTTPDAGSYATSPVLNAQDAPSEGPSIDSIPQTAQDVNPDGGDGMPNSVGAAARGFTTQNPVESAKNAPVEGAQRVYRGQILDTVRGHLGEVQEMPVVARLTGNEFQKQTGDTRPLRTKVIEFFNSLGNKVTRADIGDIALTGAGARDSTAHGYGKLKAATFAALPSVLKDGKIIEVRGPYGGHSYDSIFISAPVEVDGATHYVGALVIKDANTQRYKLHEVLTTNESGTPLFKSESIDNINGPLRSDAPLGTSGDVPTADSIPQTAQDVNPESGDGMPNSVGAAARGFTTPDAPRETRLSRQADTTLAFDDQRGAASAMTRAEWNESLRYEPQTREQWEQWAGERLFVERGGERLFIRDFDPAGYQALVSPPTWGRGLK